MQFDDFDTQVQCEEVYSCYLDYIEFCGDDDLRNMEDVDEPFR